MFEEVLHITSNSRVHQLVQLYFKTSIALTSLVDLAVAHLIRYAVTEDLLNITEPTYTQQSITPNAVVEFLVCNSNKYSRNDLDSTSGGVPFWFYNLCICFL